MILSRGLVRKGMVSLLNLGVGTGQLIVNLEGDLVGSVTSFQILFLLGWGGDNLMRGLCGL